MLSLGGKSAGIPILRANAVPFSSSVIRVTLHSNSVGSCIKIRTCPCNFSDSLPLPCLCCPLLSLICRSPVFLHLLLHYTSVGTELGIKQCWGLPELGYSTMFCWELTRLQPWRTVGAEENGFYFRKGNPIVCLQIAVHVGFVLNKVVLGQGFVQKFVCPLSISIPQMLRSYLHLLTSVTV